MTSKTMKFDILSRFSGSVIFTAEIDCNENELPNIKLGLAVKAAIKAKANLSRANLSRADLSRANLSGANLSGADLYRADLSDADLSRANLSGANLSGADLYRADLSDANLSRANLSGANLSGADLYRADLSDANLSRANLYGADLYRANLSRANLSDANLSDANLSDANLKAIRGDVWQILLQNPFEVDGLLDALRSGKVDGSVYKGDCCCLMGTIANVRHCDVSSLEQDSSRPAERFFMGIKKGDTPETNPVSKIVEEWIVEFKRLIEVATSKVGV